MKKMMMFAAVLAALAAAQAVYAQDTQDAVIKELSGTVEIKQPEDAVWKAAAKGDTLSKDTMISTGFKSTAVLGIGNSLLTVRPLTRLSLEELTSSDGSEKVGLRMQAGRVHAEVKAPAAGKIDFTIRSPSATASVRGTEFDFDTVNLNVQGGSVEFSGNSGMAVLVDSGYESSLDSEGMAVDPGQQAIADTAPPLPFAGADFGAETVSGALSPSDGTATGTVAAPIFTW